MLCRLIDKISICIFLLLGAPLSHALTTLDHAAAEIELAGAAAAYLADVPLPYHWDRLHGAVDGQARFSLDFSSDKQASPQAIYIPRIGNTFELMLNGVVIGKMGTPGGKYEDFAKQPHFFRIPSGVLHDKNTLDIVVHVQGGRNGGLSPIWIGNADETLAIYTANHRLHSSGSLIVVVVSTVLGALAFLLWCRQRETLYLMYASSEFLWAISVSDTLLERPPLPWPWWGVVFFASSASRGHGIANMQARAARINAELHFDNTAEGTSITLTLPFDDVPASR